MSQAANEPTLPTVTGFAARTLLAVLHEQKVALAPLLQRADLTNHDLDRSGAQDLCSGTGQAPGIRR